MIRRGYSRALAFTEGTNTMHVIVIGNEKGGSGKSTTAMHVTVGLLRLGRRLAVMDLDVRQGSLSRFLENRTRYVEAKEKPLPQPDFVAPPAEADEAAMNALIGGLSETHDVLVIDTPGSDTPLNRLGHSFADTLITPLNDSFIDLDVLAKVDPETLKIAGPSQYSEMVWQQKMVRAKRDGGSMDWIVMRNRLAHVDAHNKRVMGDLIADLADRIRFRTVPGFGERVIFRELFHAGLTMMDLKEVGVADGLSLSHVAARQEVRTLVEAIRFD